MKDIAEALIMSTNIVWISIEIRKNYFPSYLSDLDLYKRLNNGENAENGNKEHYNIFTLYKRLIEITEEIKIRFKIWKKNLTIR